MKALRIEWLDSQSWGNSWLQHKDVQGFQLRTITSRGEVVKETGDIIILAQSVDNNPSIDDVDTHNLIAIPKGSILKQRKIR